MSNSFAYADWITMESLRILLNKCQISQFFNTEYNKEYQQAFPVGETVRVKYPQRYTVRSGIGYQPQAIDRKYTTVTLDQIFGIDFEWDSAEKAINMERGDEMLNRRIVYANRGKRTPSVTTPHAQMGVLVNAGLARYERDLGEAGGYVIEPKGREWLAKLRAAKCLPKAKLKTGGCKA